MADITVTSNDVRPLANAVLRRFVAGGSGSVGDLVYIAADGDVEQADASAAGTTYSSGVVVKNLSNADSATFVATDILEVAVFGSVAGFSGMTPNDVLYQSDTAGQLADAAGTTSHKFARAHSATVLFVNPAITEA
ncbi:MAG: hypothetical protein GY938_16585 [Ketobacter sp.]|nr:hypothetical protein [Ketobacter sp.]